MYDQKTQPRGIFKKSLVGVLDGQGIKQIYKFQIAHYAARQYRTHSTRTSARRHGACVKTRKMEARVGDFDDHASILDYWVRRRGGLSEPEWNDFYRLVTRLLMRTRLGPSMATRSCGRNPNPDILQR